MRRIKVVLVLACAVSLLAGGCSKDDSSTITTTTAVTGPVGNPKIDADAIAPSITSGFEDNDVPSDVTTAITKCQSKGKPVKDLSTAKAATGSGVPKDTFTVAENKANHVTDCTAYDARPPVGGDHFAIWVNCGLYYDRVPDMMAVHVMEHGAVWIAYRPDLPAADLATIAKAVGATTHLLASPYPDLPAPLVLSAWGTQLQLDSTTDARFAAFLAHYIQGPQTRELGASCSGAVGTPDVAALSR